MLAPTSHGRPLALHLGMALPLGVHSIIVLEDSAAGGVCLEACVRRGLHLLWGNRSFPNNKMCFLVVCVCVGHDFIPTPAPSATASHGVKLTVPKATVPSVLSADSSPREGGLTDGHCG